MAEIEMPEGQYFSLGGRIRPDSGGQTRVLLMRNRLLARFSGVEPTLLCLDDSPTYPQIRHRLTEQGLLTTSMRLLNIFEYYRYQDVDQLPPIGPSLPAATSLDAEESLDPDGARYRTQYSQPQLGTVVMVDYRRPDGSIYLRIPGGPPTATSAATEVVLVNSHGQPVSKWPTQIAWRRHWIVGLLEPDRRAFLISDSRFAIAGLLPISDPRLYIIHLVHNIHLQPPYAWSSPLVPAYGPVFASIPHLDALVTLTSRQRDDVAARYGATGNLLVVPNPVEPVELPDPLPAREPKRFAMVTRLERQKRVEHAIRAFALVLKEEPEATLEIHGEGRRRENLAAEIEKLGIGANVHLRGFHPEASQTLHSATALLLTSRFDGYPLATLESLNRGCPVISYDNKYGPREQITDGVDGFLVRTGDVAGLAERIVQLVRDPRLAASMSDAARGKAGQHDHRAFLANWRAVLTEVVEKRALRTELTSVVLKVSRLGYLRSRYLPGELGKHPLLNRLVRSSSSSGFRAAPQLQFIGRLQVQGTSERSTLDDVVLTLEAVSQASGAITPLSLQVERRGEEFRLSSTFDPAEVFDTCSTSTRALRLRLRLVWHNSSWSTNLTRPHWSAPNFELSYAADGELSLLRGPQRTRPLKHRLVMRALAKLR